MFVQHLLLALSDVLVGEFISRRLVKRTNSLANTAERYDKKFFFLFTDLDDLVHRLYHVIFLTGVTCLVTPHRSVCDIPNTP